MDGHRQSSKIAKALTHPVRLQILEVLDREGESCVCHLEHRLGQRQAYISQQLARLRDVGLVVDRREGLNVFYALRHEAISPLLRAVRGAATAFAQAEGRKVIFRELRGDVHKACPCPRCNERELVENQQAEYRGA